MQPKTYTLGIDMGVASIGWAAVSVESKWLDCGVRVFPAGVDNFNSPKEKHPNLDRRSARGMRRRIRRKAERKALICGFLQELGWMPAERAELDAWYALDVYALRSKAIAEKISLLELGRVILHLNQRRGFLSLRKSEVASGDKDTQGMLGSINELQREINASGHRTLGNFLYQLYREKGISVRLRNRHTQRSMLHDEFSLIWETQQAFHPELTDALRYGCAGRQENPTKVVKPTPREKGISLLEQFGFENLTFFQRKVYWPLNSIGRCELEPEERRAPVADRRFQEFRMLQEVNNLRLIDNSVPGIPTERELTAEERQEVIDYLSSRKDAKLFDLKKHLCKQKKFREHLPESPDQISFNLESGGRTKISALATDHLLAKAYGKGWARLDEEKRNEIAAALLLPAATDEDIRAALEGIGAVTPEQIDSLLAVSLPTSYGHLSVKALERLLPHMRAGKIYMARDDGDSAMHAAGYRRRDENLAKEVDLLPSFQSILNADSADYDPLQAEINNPVVLRSLTELRKVVNAVIRKYGKPQRIHLEMARDLKMSPKQRAEYQKRIRVFEKERDDAAKELEKLHIVANRDAIELYRLWKEQDHLCIYSGKPISSADLFSGDLDIDHIYPYSKSADDSMANKVLCFAKENREKGNRTPCEWLADREPERFEQVLQRAKKLHRGKYKRFLTREVPEDFVNRDLNDTAWMARAARQYLARLFPRPHYVLGVKGAHTAMLRDQWELHSLLRDDGLDLKNREDHRHHALDAVVIALCEQSTIQRLTRACDFELRRKEARESGKRIYHLRTTGDKLDAPWEGFREAVGTALNDIWVSHRPQHKISGPLHEDFSYGPTDTPEVITRRKKLADLTKSEVKDILTKNRRVIRDEKIENLVRSYIEQEGGSHDALKKISSDTPLRLPSGVPILKVRVLIKNASAFPLRHDKELVIPGNTHHLAIFSLGDGAFHFEPVSLIEAVRRLRSKKEIVRKRYEGMPPGAEFLFYLCPGDSMMASIDGNDQLFVFKTIPSTTKQAKFLLHTDARKSDEAKAWTCKPNTFDKNFPNARKVTVLPTGEVRNAR